MIENSKPALKVLGQFGERNSRLHLPPGGVTPEGDFSGQAAALLRKDESEWDERYVGIKAATALRLVNTLDRCSQGSTQTCNRWAYEPKARWAF